MLLNTEIRKCKNPKCGKEFSPGDSSRKKLYCCVECKNEHYRNTHVDYYRIMAKKNNMDMATNPKYAEINGRIRYVSKENREIRERAKLMKELNETMMDTDSSDQGAYL